MDWKKFIIFFLRNVVLTLALVVLGMGVIGYLLAGWEGAVNAAIWAAVLSVFALPVLGFLIMSRFWGDYSGRFGAWWVKRETEGDPQHQVHDDDVDKWKM